MATGNAVTPELRRAEDRIDRAYLSNKLLSRPFGEAAWHYLAACEGRLILPLVAGSTSLILDKQAMAALGDSAMTEAKWPLQWIWKSCREGGTLLQKHDREMFDAALALSKLSDDYLAFEAAYTYASIGVIGLKLDHNTIVPDRLLMRNARYEAYDRLVDGGGDEILPQNDAQIQVAQQIDASLRLDGERFSYRLSPSLVRLAERAADVPLGPEPPLPAHWTFSRYSVGDFQRWARVLQALCGIHVLARVLASHAGLRDWGFADSLIIMDRREFHQRMVQYTGLDEETIGALLEDHTFGSRGIRQPDPALQPLVPLLPDKLGIAPNLLLCSRLERNFAVLMNRIPEERTIYNSLSSDRESGSRARIINTLRPMRIRHWHGNVPGWDAASEVDLALVDETSRRCLILELKSFVGPAEIREIWERSQEIAEGIAQVRIRRRLVHTLGEALHSVLGIDETWKVELAVASESSVGGVYVQAKDVPVVRTPHLLRKIVRNGGLKGIGEWLRKRDYLPVEGRHYRVEEEEPSVAGVRIKWYNIRILIDDTYI